jgi:hypothetical protein
VADAGSVIVARSISCRGAWQGGTPCCGRRAVRAGAANHQDGVLVDVERGSMMWQTWRPRTTMLAPSTGLGTPNAARQQCTGEVVRQVSSGGDGVHRNLLMGL